ncbi:tetratricopeptide repeat protein [Minwuia sp.]|uniref:tetratricopeptide repeat protein n=1 Tax=Minwuia sp. TaxID=2493630 RepID=UPI003A93570B
MFRKLWLTGIVLLVFASHPATAQTKLTPEEERAVFAENLEKAKAGDAAAQFRVALDYFRGRGVEKIDKIESAYWLQKAAEQGHKQAISRLAWHYRNGVGVIQHLPRAEELYKEAYSLGVVGSAVPLAAIYRSGEGRPIEEDGQGRVQENHAEAVRWALIAAEADIDRGQNILGELYRDGIGLHQSFAKALEWFERAAQKDLALAYYNASVIYRNPELEFQDMDKGVEYLKRAADKGHAGAMIDLALSYAAGTGVQQSYDLALEWFTKAAAKNRRSAVRLAKAYEEGVFGDPDHARAYKWYYVAQKSGEVSGIVGRMAMKEKINEPERVTMESEGDAWLEEMQRQVR